MREMRVTFVAAMHFGEAGEMVPETGGNHVVQCPDCQCPIVNHPIAIEAHRQRVHRVPVSHRGLLN